MRTCPEASSWCPRLVAPLSLSQSLMVHPRWWGSVSLLHLYPHWVLAETDPGLPTGLMAQVPTSLDLQSSISPQPWMPLVSQVRGFRTVWVLGFYNVPHEAIGYPAAAASDTGQVSSSVSSPVPTDAVPAHPGGSDLGSPINIQLCWVTGTWPCGGYCPSIPPRPHLVLTLPPPSCISGHFCLHVPVGITLALSEFMECLVYAWHRGGTGVPQGTGWAWVGTVPGLLCFSVGGWVSTSSVLKCVHLSLLSVCVFPTQPPAWSSSGLPPPAGTLPGLCPPPPR